MLVGLFMLAFGMVLPAQPPAQIEVARPIGPITVDGDPFEPAWDQIAPLPLTNLYPSFASPLTERTEIRIAYDDAHLYASIRAFDTQPGRVLATTLYRDRWVSDDEFVVILDTFGDGQNGAMFLVTPAGVRVDNQLTNDAEPGRGPWLNRDWNVVWDAAARMTGAGWFAEMKIPFSSLSFRVEAGETRMRLKTYRYIRRKGENQMFPPTRPDAGAAPHFQPSLGAPVTFTGIRASRPVWLLPYVATAAATAGSSTASVDAGLDARWAPTAATSVDATINTDFAQVEADDEQLNLTRFSLFFPEKRPFFQERAGLFTVSTGGESNLFYSRRIGLDANGQAAPLRAGVRVGARASGWDIGVLNAWVGAAAGEQNMGVLRAQRSVGRGTQLGGTLTHRVGAGPGNVAWAVDATSRVGRSTRLSITVAQSHDAALGGGAEAGRLFMRLQRDAEQGLAYSAEYRWSGRHYEPGLGFAPIKDFHEGIAVVRQRWRSPRWTWVRSHGWNVRAAGRVRRSDQGVDELSSRAEWTAEFTSNFFAGARVQTLREDVPARFTLFRGATVEPGLHNAAWLSAFVFTPEDRRLRGSATVERGSLYGGRRSTWRVTPLWNQSRHLELSADVDRTTIELPGQAPASAVIVRGRLRLAASRRWLADVFVQRSTARDISGVNGRVRVNFGEGHDLWVVVDAATEPVGPSNRALTLKYVRLLSLGGNRG